MVIDQGEKPSRAYGCPAALAGAVAAIIFYPWLWELHRAGVMRDGERLVMSAYNRYASGGNVKQYIDDKSIAKLDDLNRRRGMIVSIRLVQSYADIFMATRYVIVEVRRKWATEKETLGFDDANCYFVGVDESSVTSP